MFRSWKKSLYFVLAIILALGFPLAAYGSAGDTTRISLPDRQTNDNSYSTALSADGRFVAFDSYASNLVSGDTNGKEDTFLYDTLTKTTIRVSVATDGTQGNDFSSYPTISADGRYVAFQSNASNLVSGDTNGDWDVFVHDAITSKTKRVSVSTLGIQGNGRSLGGSISADGRYVVFTSEATNLVLGDFNGWDDIFVHDMDTDVTTRVSVATVGTQGNEESSGCSISGDGSYVAFRSYASNLVIGDTNGVADIFMHYIPTGTTWRVSVASDGTEANGSSHSPSISADGHSVTFDSYASNLVSGDTNGQGDIFLYESQTETTIRVSEATDGTQSNDSSSFPTISADGRFVGFQSDATNLVIGDTNGQGDIFWHDTQTSVTTRVSEATDGTQGNDVSRACSTSEDGRYVAFYSLASNLVSGDTNGVADIFMRDTLIDTTTRIPVAPSEANDDSSYPELSADGRYVVFYSWASNLVGGDTNINPDIFWHDTQTGVTTRVSVATDGSENVTGSAPVADISAEGRYVVFASSGNNLVSGDTNGSMDVFLHNTETGTTYRIPFGTEGNQDSYNPSISADELNFLVAFESSATNLVGSDTNEVTDIFVHDTNGGIRPQTWRVSVASDGTEGNNNSSSPSISGDGRYVAFISTSTNLVSGDTNGYRDVFVHDTQTSTTTRVSVATDGTQGNGGSYDPKISGDGRYVAFMSTASNLVTGDLNGVSDVFVHDTLADTTKRVSVTSTGVEGNNFSQIPSISDDGRYIVFKSYSSNLVSGDTNGVEDIFVHDDQTGITARVSLATGGSQGNNSSDYPAISGDGTYVVFNSSASNLVSDDTNGEDDIFVNEINTSPIENDNVGFYVPDQLKWYLKNNQTDGWTDFVAFRLGGPSGSLAISGDWDNDGVDTVGFYVPSQGKWYLENNQTDGWNDYLDFNFAGPTGSIPVAGDWNNDGWDTVGFYVPSQGKWYLKNNHLSGWTNYVAFNFGGPTGSQPVVGDWDNDGVDTVGFYVPSQGKWYLKNNQINGWFDYVAVNFAGVTGSLPVAGDWDGDSVDTIGFYVPSQLKWYLKNNQINGWNDFVAFRFGGPSGSQPVAGDWD